MNFYEQELRRIVGERFPDAVYVGRACFLPLRGGNRAKLTFATGGYADHYDRLQMAILKPDEGKVDQIAIRFSDVFTTRGQNCSGSTAPYIWDDGGRVRWYVQPSEKDIRALGESMEEYFGLFQQPVMKLKARETPTMAEQTM